MISYELICNGKLLDVAINREVPTVGDTIKFNGQLYRVKRVTRTLNEPAKVIVIKKER